MPQKVGDIKRLNRITKGELLRFYDIYPLTFALKNSILVLVGKFFSGSEIYLVDSQTGSVKASKETQPSYTAKLNKTIGK